MLTVSKVLRQPPTSMNEPLPFLVYGTLRVGEHNWTRYLKNRSIHVSTVHVPGYCLYTNGSFPYAVKSHSRSDSIVCDVILPHPSRAADILRAVDNLEGYGGIGASDNHYTRLAVPWGAVRAPEGYGWLYVASDWSESLLTARRLPVIPSGDWLDR